MRRAGLAAAVAVCALGLAGSSPGAGPIDWQRLPYLIYETQQMELDTNGTWANARVVRGLHAGQQAPDWVGPDFEKKGQKIAYIWAPHCVQGRQTATMTKTFYALGRPAAGTLYFAPGTGFPVPTIGSDILVNNRSIGYLGNTSISRKVRQYIQEDLSADDLASFRYGLNKLTIRIDKMPLRKGERCVDRNRLLGALMQLKLTFRPDLVALPSPKGLEAVTRAGAGGVVGAVGNLRFQNKGPSASVGGKLVIRISPNAFVETAASPASIIASPPFRECVGGGHTTGVAVDLTCPFDGFPAGLTTTVAVLSGGKLAPNFPSSADTSLTFSWSIIPAGGDANGANNGGRHNIVICGPTSKAPRCA